MREFAERLDAALAGHAAPDPETAPLLAAVHVLEPLRAIPPRPAAAEQAGRQAFLNEAAALRGQRPARAVSPGPAARPTGWKLNLFRKELSPMNVLVTLVLVASLTLGGAGATVYAARDSLPNAPLYGVKLAAEDLRLELGRSPQTQLTTLLELTQTRAQEMLRLAQAGEAVPPVVASRLQTHLAAALHEAAQLGDPELTEALLQIEQQTRTQLQILAQARQSAPGDPGLQLAEQALLQARVLAQWGEGAPAQFRTQQRAGGAAPEAGDGPGAGACLNGTCTPEYDGNSYGPGPGNPAVTPTGGHNQYGPNPSTPDPAATPANNPNRYGPGPLNTPPAEATGTPQPDGNRYGPGPNDPGATPAGGQSDPGPGPQPTQPADPGNGGGYGPGPVSSPPAEATCTPEQDGNSYGPGPGNPSVTPSGSGNSSGPNMPEPAATPPPGRGQP
ncbi:MAG: hypothetical protein JNK29_06235 [Anaerolineales bacterium]|nr:hypothetical protein [Anaerolineales bacterium]